MRKILITFMTLTAVLSSLQAELFYVNYKKYVPAEEIQKYRVSIISPEADLSNIRMDQPGKKIYGYLSIGEIAPDASYLNDALGKGFDITYKNKTWGSYVMYVSDPKWQRYVIDSLAIKIDARVFRIFSRHRRFTSHVGKRF